MLGCRLIVHLGPEGPLSVKLRDRAEALFVAQRYDAPIELWEGDTKLCGINRTGSEGVWVISG